jgi:hypothetical protein
MDPVQITLVHGTFASGGRWFRVGSLFGESLAKKCHAPISFHSFVWHGRNSHEARLRASEQLWGHIERIHWDFPTAYHYLVCHSHGGNVAMYAAKKTRFSQLVAGIATFGTPFIRCAPNRVTEAILNKAGYLTTILFAVMGFVFLSGFILWAVAMQHTIRNADWLFWIFSLAFWFLLLHFSRTAGKFNRRILEAIRQEQDYALAKLCIGVLSGDKHFIAKVNFDEAGIVLKAIATITLLPHRVNSFLDLIAKVTYFLQTPRGWAILSIAMFFFDPLQSVGSVDHPANYGVLILSSVMFGFILKVIAEAVGLIATVCTGVFAFLALVASRLFRAHEFGFGVEPILRSLSVDLMTVPIPRTEGPPPAVLEVRTNRLAGLVGGLRHSCFYESEQVIQALADWINRRMDAPCESGKEIS